MESTLATATSSSSKSKILPVVLLSTIPLNLWNGKDGSKVNTSRNHRTQPYERTSCSNCNKQTGNQQTTTSCESASSASSSVFSSAIKVSSMFQSPMLILPIVPAKTNSSSSSSASTAAAMQAKVLPNIIYNHQQQHQQQPLSVYHASETANRVRRRRRDFLCLAREG
jgi:hypothetical protein